MPVLLGALGLLGLLVGSFLNVVVYRVPRAISLARPGSRCPACEHPIRYRHNVPVLSWLVLRGHCADCGMQIPARYPAVELGTAALFVAVTVHLTRVGMLPALPAFLWFVSIGICLALIDMEWGRLPDVIVLPAYPVLALLLVVATIGSGDPAALLRATLGALSAFLLFYAIALVKPDGMGFGDVKTAGLIGGMLAFVSYPVLLVGLATAFLLGTTTGLLAIAARQATRTSRLPFGPFLVLGSFAAMFAGAPVAAAYQRAFLAG